MGEYMKKKQHYLVGTYTEPVLFGTGEIMEGKGEGIYFLELDQESGNICLTGCARGVRNPSYVAVSDAGYVYCVNELKEYEGEKCGSVSLLEWTGDRMDLRLRQTLPTHGQDPCHVAVDEESSHVIVSNFMTGSVCVYRAAADGSLKETDFVQHQGSSVDPKRQTGPHAHSCIRGNGIMLIPDLGLDQLVAYRFSEEGQFLKDASVTYDCRKGSGLRWGEFGKDRRFLYLVNELASSVTVLRVRENCQGFEEVQEISTLPAQNTVPNTSADLHISPDGRHLYASNRGHDSIAVFSVNEEDGTLTAQGCVSCQGKTPRNFAVDPGGAYVLVANQDSDTVVSFRRDQETGALEHIMTLDVQTPVCLCPY